LTEIFLEEMTHSSSVGKISLEIFVKSYSQRDGSAASDRVQEREKRLMSSPPYQQKIIPFPAPTINPWIDAYARAELAGKNEATIDAYLRILSQVTNWVAQLPGSQGQFHPKHLTKTAFGEYLEELKDKEYSTSHQERVKTVINGFANWLIAEGEINRNPTRGFTIPPAALLAPRELHKDQRVVLRNLVERARDLRGTAMFALGYWAGCRVSDVSYLLMKHTQVGPKVGKLRVGHKGEKYRDILLLNPAREPLYEYIQQGKRTQESQYVFTSQRETLPVPEGELDGWRLGEAAIHAWFKQLKATATEAEASFIRDVTFHDLRHDFAHRAKKEAGLNDGELAVYLGHITKHGTPAIQTTARYTQPSMDQIREKLKGMKGM
jgi:site-specific recombinase XerD